MSFNWGVLASMSTILDVCRCVGIYTRAVKVAARERGGDCLVTAFYIVVQAMLTKVWSAIFQCM